MNNEKIIYKGNIYEMEDSPLYKYYCVLVEHFKNKNKNTNIQLPPYVIPKGKTQIKEYLEQQKRFSSFIRLEYAMHGKYWKSCYNAKWKIKENKLYLVDFCGYKENREKVGIDFLYPNQKEVFAEWFTGEICIPMGKIHDFYYSHNYLKKKEELSEKNMNFNFNEGCLISSNVVDNKKTIADEYRRSVDDKSTISFGPDIKMYPEDFRSLYNNAVNFYKKLLKLFPLQAKLYLYMGEANYARTKIDQAICDYKKAIEIDPSLTEAYINLASIHSGEAGENQKYYDLDSAIIIYQKAIETNPTHDYAYYLLGLLFMKKSEYDEAISSFQNAIKNGPKINFSYEYRSSKLDRVFDTDLFNYTDKLTIAHKKKSEVLIESRIIDSQSDILSNRIMKAYIELGDIFLEQEDFNDAINYYQKSIEFVRTPEMTDDELSIVLINIGLKIISYQNQE